MREEQGVLRAKPAKPPPIYWLRPYLSRNQVSISPFPFTRIGPRQTQGKSPAIRAWVPGPTLALTVLAGMAAGILALVTDLLALIRHKETAILVYISSLIGALLIVFLIGEVLPPQ